MLAAGSFVGTGVPYSPSQVLVDAINRGLRAYRDKQCAATAPTTTTSAETTASTKTPAAERPRTTAQRIESLGAAATESADRIPTPAADIVTGILSGDDTAGAHIPVPAAVERCPPKAPLDTAALTAPPAVAEPVQQPAAEPITEQAAEPAAESITEPVAETIAEPPAARPAAQPITEPEAVAAEEPCADTAIPATPPEIVETTKEEPKSVATEPETEKMDDSTAASVPTTPAVAIAEPAPVDATTKPALPQPCVQQEPQNDIATAAKKESPV